MKKLDLRFNETKESIIEIAKALSECQLSNRAIAVLVRDSRKDLKISQIEGVLEELPRLQKKFLRSKEMSDKITILGEYYLDENDDCMDNEELNKRIISIQKKNDQLQKKIEELKGNLKVTHSYLANFIDNWNFLRGVLSNVKNQDDLDLDENYTISDLCYSEVFDECEVGCFMEAREFSESFAMNTFREWLDFIKTNYEIKNLDEHNKFKDIFWKSKELK